MSTIEYRSLHMGIVNRSDAFWKLEHVEEVLRGFVELVICRRKLDKGFEDGMSCSYPCNASNDASHGGSSDSEEVCQVSEIESSRHVSKCQHQLLCRLDGITDRSR